MSILDEIKRRNVHRVAIAYLAGAWLAVQVLDTLIPYFGLPESTVRWTVIVLALGFVPALILAWVFEITEVGIQRDADVRAGSRGGTRTSRNLDRGIILVLTVALAYFAVDKWVLTADPETDQSIVVLPFTNMSPDAEQDYFSKGISLDISYLLGDIPGLRVISQGAAEQLLREGLGLAEIAERLNVQHVLQGSVRRAGNQLRIGAELTHGRDQTQLWSNTFNREMDDVFEIQDEISARVVEQLKLEVLGELPLAETIDTDAYRLYLRGRYLNHAGKYDELELAEELLQRSLDIEPGYVPALSELGRVYLSMDVSRFGTEQDRRAAVREIVARIEDVAPDSSQLSSWVSWMARAWEGDLEKAVRYLEKSLAINPRNLNTLRITAPLLWDLGQQEEAIAVGRYVVARDPACVSCLMNLSYMYRDSGKLQQAEDVLREAVRWEPERFGIYWSLGTVMLMNGKAEEALQVFEQELYPGTGRLGRILALYSLGRSEEFEQEFAAYRADSGGPESIARIYAWSGNNDKALEWLERMVEQEGPVMLGQLGGGYYEGLIADPRFHALLEKHDLPTGPARDPGLKLALPELPR